MAAREVEDNELPDEIIDALEDFYRSVNTLEETLDPLLTKSSEQIHEKVCCTLKNMFKMSPEYKKYSFIVLLCSCSLSLL